MFKNMKHLPRPVTWGAAAVIRGWACSLRVDVQDPAGLVPAVGVESQPAICPVWHNRLLCLPAVVPAHLRERFGFLASRSRDGGYISDLLREFGMEGVRGSSSRGGARALLELQALLDRGVSLVVTPDGPRGPRYSMQEGVVWLASMTGVRIVPVALNSRKHFELNGWDRFQIPRPFSRVELAVGEPIYVDPKLDDAGRKHWAGVVRRAMLELTRYDHEPLPDGEGEA